MVSFHSSLVVIALLLVSPAVAGETTSADAGSATEELKLGVPYVPTPQAVVDRMLELAAVTKDDMVIDLGSGDGRIAITAAKNFGARAMGVDLNPARIEEAQANAKKAGVEDRVEFKQQDLFKTDISQASVLTMYLLPDVNMQLRPRILSELKPGTRVVSHSFNMGNWLPDKTETVDGRTIYFWTVPDCKVPGPYSAVCAEASRETQVR